MRFYTALSVLAILPACNGDDFQSQAGRYITEQSQEGHFMGSVLVARNGDVLFAKSYGPANAEWQIPNSRQTKFRLGSITKQFTAVAILQLAEQGKLSVIDPVSKYYAEAPASWSKVTIRHLLTHTSGIPSYTDVPEFFPRQSRDSRTPAEIIKLTQDKPLQFEPGSKWRYDNTGYIILGYIIEKVSGMKYADYLRKNVLDPAGLSDTGYDLTGPIIPKRASGYTGAAKDLHNAPYLDMTLPYAAGSLYSTVEDLLKWDQALYTDRLLSRKSMQEMYTPFLHDYAYGWGVDKQGGRLRYSHGGGINGFSSFIARYPEDRTLTVVLCNINTGLPGQIAYDLAKLSWGEHVTFPSERKDLKLDTAILDSYAGKYSGEDDPIEVIRDGDHLKFGPGPRKLTLAAQSNSVFYSSQAALEIEFTRDGVLLRQAGSETKLKKVE